MSKIVLTLARMPHPNVRNCIVPLIGRQETVQEAVMLVIIDDARQQVVFPHAGIKVSILHTCGRLFGLAIEAPESVRISDEESPGHDHAAEAMDNDYFLSADRLERERRRSEELSLLQQRVESTQRRIEQGEIFDPASTLQWLLSHLNSIDQEMSDSRVTFSKTAESPLRLLIVDDCDNERRWMPFRLARHGFDVYVARGDVDTQTHLRIWGCSRPDLVLVDLQMSMSRGLEVLHRIREDEGLADLKVFAVADCARQPELEPVGRGWDGWFQKPININRLFERLHAEIHTCLQQVGR